VRARPVDGAAEPGRLSRSELRLALAAPADSEGFTSQWASVAGVRTHYRVAGPRGGTPVVLLHGLAVSHRYLMPTARAIARTHRVYVPDLPGFGLSGKPATVYDVTMHARHVAAFATGLGLPPACLLGNSFGAEVAAAVAADHPGVAAAVMLVGPTADRAARTRTRQTCRWLLDVPREDIRQARILLRDVRDAGPRRVFRTLGHSVRHRMEQTLGRVDVPVLLMRGERDPIAPQRWLAELARGRADTTIATVPGAAHNAVTTAGPQVADLTLGLLART
jgi:pimeloyl-ACP methyl ester carboxylesterase